jgi:hypothetical protein
VMKAAPPVCAAARNAGRPKHGARKYGLRGAQDRGEESDSPDSSISHPTMMPTIRTLRRRRRISGRMILPAMRYDAVSGNRRHHEVVFAGAPSPPTAPRGGEMPLDWLAYDRNARARPTELKRLNLMEIGLVMGVLCDHFGQYAKIEWLLKLAVGYIG